MKAAQVRVRTVHQPNCESHRFQGFIYLWCKEEDDHVGCPQTEHLLFHSELHALTKYVVIRSSPTPLTHICCAPINHCHAVCKLWPTNQDMVIVASLWAHGTNHLKATPTQPYMVVKRRVSVFMYPPPRVPSPPTLLLFTRPNREGIQF